MTASALHHYVVFSLRFIAMGKTKGAKDKRPQKRRGGERSVIPITAVTPIVASSNNRRGSVTRQQRIFAAHFQHVSSVGLSDGVSIGLHAGVSDGVSLGASIGLSIADSVGVHTGASAGLSVGICTLVGIQEVSSEVRLCIQ